MELSAMDGGSDGGFGRPGHSKPRKAQRARPFSNAAITDDRANYGAWITSRTLTGRMPSITSP
jgi:hypothetical protein